MAPKVGRKLQFAPCPQYPDGNLEPEYVGEHDVKAANVVFVAYGVDMMYKPDDRRSLPGIRNHVDSTCFFCRLRCVLTHRS